MIGVLGPDGGASTVTTNPDALAVNPRLPPEVIQRVIRDHHDELRACYDLGLKANPQLAGRLVTRFVIQRDGTVTQAGDGGSTLPDETARQCMFGVFRSLRFPPPEGGIVTVVYPIVFSLETPP